MVRFAFKEWAVVCEALGRGEQALILRKGGIAEENGEFRPDHARFWLFPTYLHQKAEGLKPSVAARLHRLEEEKPAGNTVTLTHYVEVARPFRSLRLESLLELDPLHVWSEATVRMRFAYREPGLFVLPARVFRVPEPVTVINKPEYDGCKTWVDLENDWPANGIPVLDDRQFADVLETIDRVLNPVAKV
ncbi:DUF1802 family protein [Zavarzinella formosa]|uniref:DUF1802 family protein n=1 Tax=Zavarzinella formosa TaxID=360055 RepID=UPI0002DCB760|nr:DUF1802 family protein [Zavarzinella formosa]